MKRRERFAIAYCYATSTNAKTLGAYHTGGYYVEQQNMREDGSWSPPFPAIGCGDEAYPHKDHPDLLALLEECNA